jgi:hypothetical protein
LALLLLVLAISTLFASMSRKRPIIHHPYKQPLQRLARWLCTPKFAFVRPRKRLRSISVTNNSPPSALGSVAQSAAGQDPGHRAPDRKLAAKVACRPVARFILNWCPVLFLLLAGPGSRIDSPHSALNFFLLCRFSAFRLQGRLLACGADLSLKRGDADRQSRLY